MSDKEQKLKEATREMFDSLNVFGCENELRTIFLDTVSFEHRTLKQSFMRTIIIPFIEHFAIAYEEGTYDLRNEATCKLCYELKKITDKHALPFV